MRSTDRYRVSPTVQLKIWKGPFPISLVWGTWDADRQTGWSAHGRCRLTHVVYLLSFWVIFNPILCFQFSTHPLGLKTQIWWQLSLYKLSLRRPQDQIYNWMLSCLVVDYFRTMLRHLTAWNECVLWSGWRNDWHCSIFCNNLLYIKHLY